MYGYGNSMFLATHAILARPSGGIDPDAQAFITAAAITDPTQQSAINTLVVDLKGYNIWTKMKALYPFVGGTAAQHKWNLKDPRDLDAAFRLVFNGGWTHSSTGATPNGTNAYADTKLLASTQLALNSTHVSVYSRTNTDILAPSIANYVGANNFETSLWLRTGNLSYLRINTPTASTQSTTDSRGTFIGNRNSSTQQQLMVRGTRYDYSVNSNSLNSINNYWLGGGSFFAGGTFWDTKQLAFASIGDGLTNTEMTNLTTAVQAFQVTLGRSIGTQTVSDADAQAFVTNAGIVDQVEANAVNNLVIGLKADGLWSKMKAIYPFVGGSSTTNSYNLKNTAQYQITWYGGVTHSANGILGNGSNGYGDTFLANNLRGQNDNHHSVYVRTTSGGNFGNDLACYNGSTYGCSLYTSYFLGGLTSHNNSTGYSTLTTSQGGFFLSKRTSSTQIVLQRNTTQQSFNVTSTNNITTSFKLLRSGDYNGEYSNKNLAFASIGDGLTDAEALNLNTRITTFQTALNRNV